MTDPQELKALTDRFVKQLSPKKVFLFGSFAKGSEREDSDYDFYIVMPDDTPDLADAAAEAYRSVRFIKQRPIDILVGTDSYFESRRHMPSMENEVFTTGVLLYER